MLRDLEDESQLVIGDLEAGTGTIMRMAQRGADLAMVVTQPTAKANQVARHALAAAEHREIPAVLVANRVNGDEDFDLICESLWPQLGIPAAVARVPDDRAVARADQAGLAPADFAPQSPAVLAVTRMAENLPKLAADVG